MNDRFHCRGCGERVVIIGFTWPRTKCGNCGAVWEPINWILNTICADAAERTDRIIMAETPPPPPTED